MNEDELAALQQQSVDVLAASTSSPKHVLPSAAAALLVAVPALCDEVRTARTGREALREALRDLYAYTVEVEGAMGPWLITRPHMARLPGTQEGRDALGARTRALLEDVPAARAEDARPR